MRAAVPAWLMILAAALLPPGALAEDTAEREDAEPAVSGTALSGAAPPAPRAEPRVMDELDLGRTEITGNRELPKVLYIVPWKPSDLGDVVGRPVNSLLDEVLEPVDREVFVRQVGYYQNLYAGPVAGGEPGTEAGEPQ